jgi:hypothetical protein
MEVLQGSRGRREMGLGRGFQGWAPGGRVRVDP